MILSGQKVTDVQVERLERKLAFYSQPEGELELFNLMLDAKFFREISEKDVPLRNYAVRKLTELGFNQEDKLRKLLHEALNMPAVYRENHEIVEDAQESAFSIEEI